MSRSSMWAVMLSAENVPSFTVQITLEAGSVARRQAILSQAGFECVYSRLLRFEPRGFGRRQGTVINALSNAVLLVLLPRVDVATTPMPARLRRRANRCDDHDSKDCQCEPQNHLQYTF